MSAEAGSRRLAPLVGCRRELAARLDDGRYLASRVVVAKSLLSRFWGLMGRPGLDPEEGLWLVPCRSIHMFFMRTAIDIVFLDRDGVVVRAVSRMRPWSLRPLNITLLPVARAHSALELAPGTLERLGVAEGAHIDLVDLRAEVAAPGRAAFTNSNLNSGE